ncbi:hypothetical protein AZI86_04245 [Bdellovibrio bacteriovorus]|uniref:Bdellovibrio beta-sandwich domain-containing protein n=1 Tax=Bdellovibrio bacteriovorus TaxID=959 RepID=A0A150WPI8_BDEBC|nr:hypothetical protein [Bdellovibrio bacteriovorus]KYG66276.1 hypothetical protein AZI86_04245 [Bdellovibrio bacteriovorus]
MRFQFLCMTILTTLVSFSALAATTNLNVAIGTSVPNDPAIPTYNFTTVPSRSGGGEKFTLKFASAKNITSIKLSGFSIGRAGKVLVRNVTAISGAATTTIPELFQFKKMTVGNAQNYKDLVMLVDSSYVEVTPNQVFSQIEFLLEGYTNDDASLLIEIASTDSLTEDQFMFTRGGSSQSLGALIDESKFAKFSPDTLAKLMRQGKQVQAADLEGKNFVCSSYTKLDNAQINLKRRAYQVNAKGVLQSQSDLEGTMVWQPNSAGMVSVIANQNGCGTYTSYNVIRKTASGNLIAEVNLNLEDYVKLCASAGYDADGTRAVELNSTFASVIDPAFVVNNYEFCQIAN